MRRHDYETEQALRQRVQADPRRADTHLHLAGWLYRAGRCTQAREALQAALGQADRTAPVHHLLGLLMTGAGDHEAAERHLQRAAEQEPGRFDYARDLALVQGAAGRTASSVETLRQAVGLAGERAAACEPLLRLGERALVESGVRPQRRPPGISRRAAVIERVVRRDPEVAEALVSRLEPHASVDRDALRAARRTLARLLAENPSYADLHFSYALVAEHLGEIDRAIEAAETALRLNPRYAEACLLAMRLYERTGRADQAAEQCRQVTRLRPKWVDAHLRLGHLLRQQGRSREAAAAYRSVLGLDGRCAEARRRLDSLDAALAEEGVEP